MLRSTPFLTEFAPLMVLKIYKWKTNLCFFFSGKQIFHKRQKLILQNPQGALIGGSVIWSLLRQFWWVRLSSGPLIASGPPES